MKTLIPGLAMTILSLGAMNSCEKDPALSAKKKPSATSVEKSGITLTLSAGGTCSTTAPCEAVLGSTGKINRLTITRTSSNPNVVYSFYRKTGTSGSDEIYTGIPGAQYTCSAGTVYFAKGSILNGDRILVFANTTSSPSNPDLSIQLYYNPSTMALSPLPLVTGDTGYKVQTMGNFLGQSCTES